MTTVASMLRSPTSELLIRQTCSARCIRLTALSCSVPAGARSVALALDLQVHLMARKTAEQRTRRSTDEEAEQAAQDLALQCHPLRSPVVVAPDPLSGMALPPS